MTDLMHKAEIQQLVRDAYRAEVRYYEDALLRGSVTQ